MTCCTYTNTVIQEHGLLAYICHNVPKNSHYKKVRLLSPVKWAISSVLADINTADLGG